MDVSNPRCPSDVGYCPASGTTCDIAISQGYAYLANWDGGLHVLDISDVHDPAEIGHLDTPGSAYGVAVSGDHAYVGAFDSGLRVVDISDPGGPVEVGHCVTSNMAYGVCLFGNYACVATNWAGLASIIDATDPHNPGFRSAFAPHSRTSHDCCPVKGTTPMSAVPMAASPSSTSRIRTSRPSSVSTVLEAWMSRYSEDTSMWLPDSTDNECSTLPIHAIRLRSDTTHQVGRAALPCPGISHAEASGCRYEFYGARRGKNAQLRLHRGPRQSRPSCEECWGSAGWEH